MDTSTHSALERVDSMSSLGFVMLPDSFRSDTVVTGSGGSGGCIPEMADFVLVAVNKDSFIFLVMLFYSMTKSLDYTQWPNR